MDVNDLQEEVTHIRHHVVPNGLLGLRSMALAVACGNVGGFLAGLALEAFALGYASGRGGDLYIKIRILFMRCGRRLAIPNFYLKAPNNPNLSNLFSNNPSWQILRELVELDEYTVHIYGLGRGQHLNSHLVHQELSRVVSSPKTGVTGYEANGASVVARCLSEAVPKFPDANLGESIAARYGVVEPKPVAVDADIFETFERDYPRCVLEEPVGLIEKAEGECGKAR